MFNRNNFNALLKKRGDLLISIFIPTHRVGNEQEDQLTFKNVLSELLEKLKGQGYSEVEAKALLSKAYGLLEDNNFWRHLSDGLAVFLSDNDMEYYLVPFSFKPFSYIGNAFYLKPLFPIVSGEERFFLLALSQNEVRLFEGNMEGLDPINIEGEVPENMEVALDLDVEKNRVQMHSGSGTGRAPIYHGHISENQKINHLKTYFKQIDQGLSHILKYEKIPLVLASVDYYIPIFKDISSYPFITKFHISGNPESISLELMHEKAWKIIENAVGGHKKKIREKFKSLIGTGKASYDLQETILASKEGRIRYLFIPRGKYAWGHYEKESKKIMLSKEPVKGDIELLNEIALVTYKNGGIVYSVEPHKMPHPTALACAIFRH